MVSTRSSSGLAAATILLFASSAMASNVNTVSPTLAATLTLPAATPALFGCYNSAQGMTWTGNYNYMTSSICQIYCLNANKPVLGTSAGTDCWCGDYAPPSAAKVDSSQCDYNCTGFGTQMCGGYNTTSGGVVLSIWNDQLEHSISETTDQLTSSSSTGSAATGASSTSPPAVTVTNPGGSVVTIVQSGSAQSGGTSKAGIAAGVVVGIIAIAAIAGAAWFWIRQKKRREVEEEHKRQVAVSSFINSGKPGSSGGQSMPDARLDAAVLRDRRMSDGSIMDNQDYSRRILKVTNA